MMSIMSNRPYNDSHSFTITALRDGIQEETETAYLVVELRGTMTFPDGSRTQIVERRCCTYQ